MGHCCKKNSQNLKIKYNPVGENDKNLLEKSQKEIPIKQKCIESLTSEG